jgi:hypothetical protein
MGTTAGLPRVGYPVRSIPQVGEYAAGLLATIPTEGLVLATAAPPQNMLRHSENLADTAWVKNEVTIVPNAAIAPDGYGLASAIFETTANTLHRIQQSVPGVSGERYVLSFFAKAGTRSWIRASITGFPVTVVAYLNIADGSVGNLTACSASIVLAGDGWFRCVIVPDAAMVSAMNVLVGPSLSGTATGYGGGVADYVLLWGVQYEPGIVASTYRRTEALQTIVNTAPGHNLLLRSEEFDHATWTKTRASIVANAAANPLNGAMTADTLVENTEANSHDIRYAVTGLTIGETYTVSVYAKRAAGTRNLRIQDSVLAMLHAVWDLDAQAVSQSNVGVALTPLPLTDGWARYAVTFVATASSFTLIAYLVSGANVINYTGDGASGIHLWGAQLNVGPLQAYTPTSDLAASVAPLGVLPGYNLVRDAFAFDRSTWTKTRATIVANTVANPLTGETDADKIVETGPEDGDDIHEVQQIAPMSPRTTHTGSVYLRAGERVWARLSLFDVSHGAIRAAAWVDLAAGELGAVSHGTARVERVGSGWIRVSVTGVMGSAAINGRLQVRTALADAQMMHPGDGVSGIYVWGAQVVPGDHSRPIERTRDVAPPLHSGLRGLHGQNGGAAGSDTNDAVNRGGRWYLTTDDFITFGTSPQWNMGTQDFTVYTVVRPSNLSGHQSLFNRRGVAGGGNPGWGLRMVDDDLAVEIGANNTIIFSDYFIGTGWVVIGCSVDRDTGMYVYRDGALFAQNSTTAVTDLAGTYLDHPNLPLLFGRTANSGIHYFTGEVAIVGIVYRGIAHDANQQRAIYQAIREHLAAQPYPIVLP